jgi:flavin-dependent dehydrogenase
VGARLPNFPATSQGWRRRGMLGSVPKLAACVLVTIDRRRSYFPEDYHLVASRVMAFLAREVEAAGGETRYRTSVRGWRRTNDRIDAAEIERL